MTPRIDIEDMTDAQDEAPLTREQQIALMVGAKERHQQVAKRALAAMDTPKGGGDE